MSTLNFAQQPKPGSGKAIGLGIAIAFHALLGYALLTGLAAKVVDVIKRPLETKVIEEITKPPPPPEIALPPPPKLELPPPPFIPPPEVQVAVPPPPQQAVIATTPTPPPASTDIAPAAPPVLASPPKPSVVAIGVACPKMVAPKMPANAVAEEISGAVTARITVRAGKVAAVEIIKSQPRGVFDAAVRAAVMQYQCQSSADQEVQAVQEFAFKNGE